MFAVLEKSSQSTNLLRALRAEKNLQVCLWVTKEAK